MANGIIHSVAVDASGNVYAAGEFTNASSNYYVAKWNGSAWSELGGANALGADSLIYAVITDASGNVYTGGMFVNTGGKHYVAEWNGSAWSELGAGSNALNANGYIDALAVGSSGHIYAAGIFSDIYGADYVAEYSPILSVSNISNTANSVHLYPNPASGTLTISLQNNSGNAQVHITDMVGKEIYNAVLNNNELSVNAGNWSNGMYICTVYDGDVKTTTKFVVNH
jgi:hypothetical protein